MNKRRRFIFVLAAGALGCALGAALGNGPLLRYSSQGLLSMGMSAEEYKRFSELATNAGNLRSYAQRTPLPVSEDADRVIRKILATQWVEPVLRFSRVDAKNIPDALMARLSDPDANEPRDVRQRNAGINTRVYMGVNVSQRLRDPNDAAEAASWLGIYFRDVAAREAGRDLVSVWRADTVRFASQADERRVKLHFVQKDAQARVEGFKKVLTTYPMAARGDSSQVINIGRENEKFLSPVVQLVAAEAEMIRARGDLEILDRESEQDDFTRLQIPELEKAVAKSEGGAQTLDSLSQVLEAASKRLGSEAQRERASAMLADVAEIRARFLVRAEFITKPEPADSPVRPGPLVVTAMAALLMALFAAVVIWRREISDLLWRVPSRAQSDT